MMTLDGYNFSENLYQSTRTEVYRGTRIRDNKPVIIKVLRNPNPTFKELVQFRNQYVITRNLEHREMVQPLALERYGNGYALVMPDDGAIALSDYWQQSDRSLVEFLTIAMQLADALHYLTGQRIVHKDIKPANILIHPETGKVKLIDFSISSLLPKEQQQLINPNVLEGTLAYISPEQTGRMNRGIDYRTDFYSLGVTFFELLTGKLPFASSDPMELVHCHIAQEVQFPGDSQVDEVVQAIVLKLMAKNAENRYQSALGLQHDLRICLQQLEATGKITGLEIGKLDRCDRFIIPEKLYGREGEVETLLAAFDRVAGGNTEMMLVAGFSGIGKTAVVNEVHKPIVRQRGYFIKGKFDQFNRNIPFSAFVQAFRDLMGQLLGDSDASLASWKEKILAAVGENGQVLIEVIPELERIIGKQPPVPELSGNATQNRFNLLFQKFIAVFTTAEHPLTMFLDDLQWAEEASLNLMKVLMNNRETGYLLLLGAYRDNEVFRAHPLMLALSELEKERAVISTLVLEPLALHHVNQLVAQTLSCSAEVAEPLTELVYQKTKGNPFFTNQFLKGLHQDELIAFNLDLGYWECDLVQVRDVALTGDVVEFMAGRLALLPPGTQNALKLAACIGNQFALETLAVICESSSEEVAADIWSALQEGLILPISEAYKFFQGDVEEAADRRVTVGYRFLHDRVQQAAYSLIDEELKPETHLKIGRLLLSNLSESAVEENIFDVTNQLNMGRFLICDRLEKDELARLNLMAGRKAKSSTAYSAASDYFNLGIQLIEDGWHRQYDLMLSLYLEAIESEYMSTQFDNSKELADRALKQAASLLDKVKIHELQIQYYIAKGQRKQAVDLGVYSLKLLNIELDGISPEVANIEALANLPEIADSSQILALRILIATVSAAVIAAPDLLVSIGVKMVNICISYGNSQLAPYAYGFHAWMLCGFLGEIESGYRFGKLAIELLDKFDARQIKCKVEQQFNVFVRHRKEPLKNMISLVEAVQSGIEVGDIEYACYAAQDYCILQFFIGQNLDVSLEEQKKYLDIIRHHQQDFSVNFTSPWLQLVSNLLSKSPNMYSLAGEFFDEGVRIAILQEQNDNISLFPIFFIKTYLSYLLGDYRGAVENAISAENCQAGSSGFIYYPAYLFYCSLALLALASRSTSEEEKQNYIDRANCNQYRLAIWVNDAPFNYQHKYDLVAAEYNRFLGKKLEAIELYDRAISGAKANEYLQEEALANELAAKFYLDWGKEKVASGYMQEAYYCYARWGAKAKTNQLETQYRQLLTPIVQQPQSNVSLSTTIKETQALGTATTTSSVLDLASAIKAGQAISGEISLDALLSKVMQIVVENAGADRGSLILNHSGRWEIAAQCVNNNCNLSTMPLDDASTLPLSIINTVRRTQQTLLINDINQDTTFAGDPYLIQQQPLCLFCTPILHQGQLRGILYLENNLAAGAFTTDRIEVLNLLTAQAAISIENAQLYNTLEQKVKERTAELSQALEDLKATQKQLVESEKMAALGGLVAGVAHEINTPIGTSITVASTLADETQSFLNAVKQGQLKRSVLNNYLDLAGESTQLMLSNLNRAGELIGSFKQIATDQSNLEQRSFHLKQYLEEVALSLAPKLKQTPHTLTVAGDSDVTIESYPGALAQIVTNLVTNSLTHGYPSSEVGQLRLQIGLKGDKVQVEYSDDGCGIEQDNLGKIFEPFFTTARNKGGTGLGLHIVYNLVTQKLLGTLVVSSEVGAGTRFVMTLPLSVN